MLKRYQRGLICDICNICMHTSCAMINNVQFNNLSHSDKKWFCIHCLHELFPFMILTSVEFTDLFSTVTGVAGLGF